MSYNYCPHSVSIPKAGGHIMHNTDTSRQCAICGHPLPEDHFYIEERWSKSEVESSHITPQRLSRSQIDDQGRYVFYFCRWRHL